MPFIKKILLSTAFISLLISMLLSSVPAHSSPTKPTTVKLQLFWHHQFEFAGFYAAIEQGYFEKYHIKVELLEYEPSLDITNLVLTNKAQFGLAGTDLIEDFHRGKDVKLLASYFKRSPLIIITQPEITSLKQLINQKVFGNDNQLKQGSIKGMLNLFSIKPEEIAMTSVGNSVALFKDKKITGILAYRTNIPYELNYKHIPYRMYDPDQFGMVSQDLNLFTTGSFAKENPELVKNFTLAVNEGWRFAIKHPNKLINLIKSQYNNQNLTKEALKFEATETIKLISPDLFAVGSVQKNKLAAISEESFARKTISTLKNLDDFIFQLKEKQLVAPELLKLLTLTEKEYLKKNPVLKVQNENDYPPFNYSVNGKPTGYSIDYIRMLAKKMGVKLQFIQHKSWQEYLKMLRDKKLDVMVNIMASKERKQFYNFTTPFAEPNNVAVIKDSDIDIVINIDSIKNKKLVVVDSYAASEKYEKLFPLMTIIKVKNVLEALKIINSKEADLFISNDAVINFYIEKHYISGLKLVPLSINLEYPNTLLSLATHVDNPTLANIFQKSMSTVAEHEALTLRRRWLGEIKNNNKVLINLTPSEKQYLIKNPIIRIQNDANFPPFNYLINGKPNGYSIDLMEKISTMLGVKLAFVSNKKWSEYLTMLQEKEIDMMVNIVNIKSRRGFAGFTTPYAEIATMAVSRKSEFNLILTKKSLANQRIVITTGYATNESLKRAFPTSTFIEVPGTVEALTLISQNMADIYFEAGAVLNYYISNRFMSELKVISVPPDFGIINQHFSLATHKDNAIFLSILQKSLIAIPDIEHFKLKQKWLGKSNKEQKVKENLTKEEINYISQTTFTLCRSTLYQSSSTNIPLIDLITRNLGMNIKMGQPLPWSETLKALENKACDILLEVTNTASRQTLFNFTPNYYRDKLAMITKKNQKTFYDISDLLTKTFAILKDSSSNLLLKNHYPAIKLITVNTPLDGINLINKNQALGYLYPSSLAQPLLKNNQLGNMKINMHLREQFDDLQAIATRKEDDLLNSILTKALANTDKNDIEKIIHKEEVDNGELSIILSKEERSLLKNREIIWCFSSDSKNWAELIPYMASVVNMTIVKSNVFSWGGALKELVNGSCDFLPEVTPTTARQKTMIFTPTIHQEERVIVTVDEKKFISNINDYLEQTFAVVQGDLVEDLLINNYPNIKLKLVDYELDGLQQVQQGQVFGYIASISVTSNTISQYALKNLKISGSLPDKFMDDWTIATRKDDVLLNSIFSKIILAIDKKTLRKKLFDQYSIKYDQGFDYTLFWKFLFVVLIILAAIIFWNRRLAVLNLQMQLSKKAAEDAQRKVESQNREILATQQQLIQSAKMASLGTLTAGVAHEINNPTNFTYTAVYLMKNEIDEIKSFLKQLAGGDNADIEVLNSFDAKFEKLIELTTTASEGTKRIKVIVEDLRTFAHLGDAKQAQLKVSELITSTSHLVKTQYDNITIKTNFKYDPLIKCFPSKINQVFMNIIVNACQSIKNKIKQHDELHSNNAFEGLVTINTSEQNNYLVISISDNGCGMDELTKQKVCEPFFTTKDVGSGTGLGMAISFGIIEEHAGMLKISSVLTQGADFSIYLPVINDDKDKNQGEHK